jgi:4-amino-4-deoxy-L-arabinose transferase-like glycosyltransferase
MVLIEPELSARSAVEPTALRSRARAWLPEVVVLLTVAVLVPVAVAAHYGSLNAPGSDDWAYDLSVYQLAFHGHLNFYHWSRITLVGQILMGVPVAWLFGEHAWALNIETCIVGWVGLMSLVYLGRRLGLGRRTALFAALVVGLGPMWTSLSTTFMADVPSLSFMALSLAVAASDREQDRLVTTRSVTSLLLGAFAFSIRDQAGVVFAAIVLARILTTRRYSRKLLGDWLLVAGTVGAAMLTFYIWRQHLPSSGGGGNQPPYEAQTLWYRTWFFPLLGVCLTPIAAVVHPLATLKAAWQRARRYAVGIWLIMPVGPIALEVITHIAALTRGSVGNRLTLIAPSFGNYYFNFDTTAPLALHPYLPAWFAIALGVVSAISLAVVESVVLLAVLRHIDARSRGGDRPREAVPLLVGLTAAGSVLIFVVLVEMELVTWDRYMLPISAFCGLAVLYLARSLDVVAPVSRPRPATPALGLALVAAVSLVTAIAFDGFVGSEWQDSNAFAASVPGTPRGEIFTLWVWTSTQNRTMTDPANTAANTIPGYTPCYIQVDPSVGMIGLLDVRRAGSWVEPYTWAMISNRPASDPTCHLRS